MISKEKILKISKKTGIPVKIILDALFSISREKGLDNNLLISKVGVSKKILNDIKSELSDILKPTSANTVIKDEYLEELKKLFTDNYISENNLLNSSVNTLPSSPPLNRVETSRKLDQFLATQSTVIRRASLMDFLEDIEGKNILFLGDDDHTSLQVAKLKKAKSIQVIDVDDRIVKNINDTSIKLDFKIQVFKHDLREVLPEGISNKFDVVFTDPPYTPEGARLFLSRAVAALDPDNKAARIYCCYGVSDGSKERFLPLYGAIMDHGLMIRYIFDKFNRYEGAESIGNTSSLFILDITPRTNVILKNKYDKPIYTCD